LYIQNIQTIRIFSYNMGKVRKVLQILANVRFLFENKGFTFGNLRV